MQVSEGRFRQWKKQCLENHPDQSRKGGIDEKIVQLVELINRQDDYFTTSSCSGRLICFVETEPGQKKGCQWLLVSHAEVSLEDLTDCLKKLPANGIVFFKFEPFVLHLCCRTLEGAKQNMECAVETGFRNSGISLGKNGKIILAVRSTHSMETPVAVNGEIVVNEKFLKLLIDLGNQKMAENFIRLQRFQQQLERGFNPLVPVPKDDD